MRVMAAPIPSVEALLKKTGVKMEQVDLVEHNEAFATASCAVMSALHVPKEKFNVSGGAVALGHPLGASGARVLTTLLHNLKRTGGKRGIATLCLGGGNAVSAMVERE
jgi:acetyl-CoA C-acetyltransferase